MNRLSVCFLFLVIICALMIVQLTNTQRHLFILLQHEQAQAHRIQQEYTQLQYEDSALSKTARIARIATQDLKMHSIMTERTQYLTFSTGVVKAVDTPVSASKVSSLANQS